LVEKKKGSRAFKILFLGVVQSSSYRKRKRREESEAGSSKRRRLWGGSMIRDQAGKQKRRGIGEVDGTYDPGEFENIDSEGAALPVPLQLEFGEAKLNGKLADFFLDKNQYPANPNRTISNTVTLNMPFGTNRINVGDGIIIDFKNPRKTLISRSPPPFPQSRRGGDAL